MALPLIAGLGSILERIVSAGANAKQRDPFSFIYNLTNKGQTDITQQRDEALARSKAAQTTAQGQTDFRNELTQFPMELDGRPVMTPEMLQAIGAKLGFEGQGIQNVGQQQANEAAAFDIQQHQATINELNRGGNWGAGVGRQQFQQGQNALDAGRLANQEAERQAVMAKINDLMSTEGVVPGAGAPVVVPPSLAGRVNPQSPLAVSAGTALQAGQLSNKAAAAGTAHVEEQTRALPRATNISAMNALANLNNSNRNPYTGGVESTGLMPEAAQALEMPVTQWGSMGTSDPAQGNLKTALDASRGAMPEHASAASVPQSGWTPFAEAISRGFQGSTNVNTNATNSSSWIDMLLPPEVAARYNKEGWGGVMDEGAKRIVEKAGFGWGRGPKAVSPVVTPLESRGFAPAPAAAPRPMPGAPGVQPQAPVAAPSVPSAPGSMPTAAPRPATPVAPGAGPSAYTPPSTPPPSGAPPVAMTTSASSAAAINSPKSIAGALARKSGMGAGPLGAVAGLGLAGGDTSHSAEAESALMAGQEFGVLTPQAQEVVRRLMPRIHSIEEVRALIRDLMQAGR